MALAWHIGYMHTTSVQCVNKTSVNKKVQFPFHEVTPTDSSKYREKMLDIINY